MREVIAAIEDSIIDGSLLFASPAQQHPNPWVSANWANSGIASIGNWAPELNSISICMSAPPSCVQDWPRSLNVLDGDRVYPSERELPGSPPPSFQVRKKDTPGWDNIRDKPTT